MRQTVESSLTVNNSTRTAQISLDKAQSQSYNEIGRDPFSIRKASIFMRIYGLLWRFFYLRRRRSYEQQASVAYAELMAERDAKGLITKNA
uniref:hypothetical protein n=1 Tax=Alistipes sp. TaxID=1872444 RepID=UPI004055BC95